MYVLVNIRKVCLSKIRLHSASVGIELQRSFPPNAKVANMAWSETKEYDWLESQ